MRQTAFGVPSKSIGYNIKVLTVAFKWAISVCGKSFGSWCHVQFNSLINSLVLGNSRQDIISVHDHMVKFCTDMLVEYGRTTLIDIMNQF